ncbi:hypothetical protein PRUB_a2972 [Pseudoalteromonas rubra]|uniref:Uncharacterized protein n=1 Tax=Pseudoalteromonas rubra TaxID=43658 RepID=A0A8T0CCA9_9GAMM|nr:hypothetical protein PRUB_a2972 [Pseudoalteromonas rubra]
MIQAHGALTNPFKLNTSRELLIFRPFGNTIVPKNVMNEIFFSNQKRDVFVCKDPRLFVCPHFPTDFIEFRKTRDFSGL